MTRTKLTIPPPAAGGTLGPSSTGAEVDTLEVAIAPTSTSTPPAFESTDGFSSPASDSEPLVLQPVEPHTAPSATGSVFGPDVGDTSFIDRTPSGAQTKFMLPKFGDGPTGELLVLSNQAFQAHDEPAIFALMNGRPIPGLDVDQVPNMQFETMKDVRAYLDTLPSLPLGLQKVAGRYVLPAFYDQSRGTGRQYGLGSFHYSSSSERRSGVPKELLAFDVVFNDTLTPQELRTFWTRISDKLSPRLQEALRWIPRSAPQEKLADRLANDTFWSGKILREKDLTIPGKSEVYSDGGAAGRVKYFARGTFDPSKISSEDILLLEELPDELPPVRGILTTVRQGQLAHVNLLAKASGIPNVHLADDAMVEELKAEAQSREPVAIRADSTGTLCWKRLSENQYTQYEARRAPTRIARPSLPLEPMPDLLEGWTGQRPDEAQILAQYGGKVLGLMHLNRFGLRSPEKPLGVNERLYQSHMEGLRPTIEKLLQDDRFKVSAAVRFVVLEGLEAYRKANPAGDDSAVEQLLASTDSTDPLKSVVEAGGLKAMIVEKPLDPKVRDALSQQLDEVGMGTAEGFRFRSSATSGLEDGALSGAGLYDSYSYKPGDNRRPLDRALKRVWASYWNFRAFEAREQVGFKHLEGGMGVAVHRNFPDDQERANAVVVATLHREKLDVGGPPRESVRLSINTRPGSSSVVRPDPLAPEALPEIATVEKGIWDGNPRVSRVQAATGETEPLLTDAQLLEIYEKLKPVLRARLSETNEALPAEEQNMGLTLDLELKEDDSGITYKQMRPLERAPQYPAELEALPIPRDMLANASKIERRTFTDPRLDFSTVEVYEPTTRHDGSFVAQARFKLKEPMFGHPAGKEFVINHTDIEAGYHPFMHHGPYDLTLQLKPEAAARVGLPETFETLGSHWSFGSEEGTNVTSTIEQLLNGPKQWLEELFAQPPQTSPGPAHGGGRIRF